MSSIRTLFATILEIGEVRLDPEESRHAGSVLRLGPGDPVWLVDGAGRRGQAVVVALRGGTLTCMVAAIETVPAPTAAALTMAVAAPKGARFEDMVRGLTELGVGRICPLVCARASRLPDCARARRVAREAMKQCGRADLPQFGPVLEIKTVRNWPGRRIVLDRQGLAPTPGGRQDTLLVIGPEGGFTDEEREALLDGAEAVRLASPVLRIETAALAAAAIWACSWEHHG